MKAFIAALVSTVWLLGNPGPPGGGAYHAQASETAQRAGTGQAFGDAAPSDAPSELRITVNKSAVVDHGMTIRRVSVGNAEIAEAVAVSATELLINGKAPGQTSLILWDARGARTKFEVDVVPNDGNIEAVRRELGQELPGQNVSLVFEDGTAFLRGTVNDLTAADRAFAIASTLGKVVNLLRVLVPPQESQILLKVRFANLERAVTTQLGINLFTLDPSKNIAQSTTGQFGQPPAFDFSQTPYKFTVTDLLNLFYYRPDINFGAILQDLEAKQVLQILAEPNLLTVSGRPASFLAGGEFPFPTLQGGAAGVGQITIQFKEFGIRLGFLPTITPRGTIRLVVTPEVSSLDYANGLTVSGFTIPGLSTRRVQTEIELRSGQSFVIAGLLDNQVTENLNRIPGLASIPLFGKLFQSRSVAKNNTELLVLVTPELIAPIPAGAKLPEVKMPYPFLKGTAKAAPRNPGPEVTGPIPATPAIDSLPVEEMKSISGSEGSSNGAPNPAPANPGIPALPPIQPSQAPPGGTASPAAAPATASGNPPNPTGSSR